MIPTSELERFIFDFEERLAPVERAADEAWWNLATSGTEGAQEGFVAANKAYTGLFSDAEEYGKLRDLFHDLDSVESPLLRRRIEARLQLAAIVVFAELGWYGLQLLAQFVHAGKRDVVGGGPAGTGRGRGGGCGFGGPLGLGRAARPAGEKDCKDQEQGQPPPVGCCGVEWTDRRSGRRDPGREGAR